MAALSAEARAVIEKLFDDLEADGFPAVDPEVRAAVVRDATDAVQKAAPHGPDAQRQAVFEATTAKLEWWAQVQACTSAVAAHLDARGARGLSEGQWAELNASWGQRLHDLLAEGTPAETILPALLTHVDAELERIR